eukprot:930036-Amphidinium_carterae.1
MSRGPVIKREQVRTISLHTLKIEWFIDMQTYDTATDTCVFRPNRWWCFDGSAVVRFQSKMCRQPASSMATKSMEPARSSLTVCAKVIASRHVS